MNIFFLDESPNLCAQYLGDKHCVKMVLETAQMLSTAQRLSGQYLKEVYDAHGLYQATHANHPMSLWVRQSQENYDFTWSLFSHLCLEFEYRRGKEHKCSSLINSLNMILQTPHKRTTPPLCMPDEFKTDDVVESYRRYYFHKYQEGIVEYNWGREMPQWLKDMT